MLFHQLKLVPKSRHMTVKAIRISPVTCHLSPDKYFQVVLASALYFCSVVQYTCIECIECKESCTGGVQRHLEGGWGRCVGQVLLDGGRGIAERWKWRHRSKLVAFTHLSHSLSLEFCNCFSEIDQTLNLWT